MKIQHFILFLFGFLIGSCSSNVAQKPLEEKPVENPWKWLKIKVDQELIWIPATEDTCFYRKKFDEIEISKEGEKKQKIISDRFVLNQQQRDSLFLLGQDAVKNFVESDHFVTCYAGQYVTITLEGYSGSISCGYNSISDWSKVSKTLSKISKLTFEKVKK